MAKELKIPEEIIGLAISAAESIRKGMSLLDQLAHRIIPAEWADGFIVDLSPGHPGMAKARCATR